MPHENQTMRPPGPQHDEQEPMGEDLLQTASNWSLGMLGLLALVAIAILVMLAILSARAVAQNVGDVTVATGQELIRGAESGVHYRPLSEFVSMGRRDLYAEGIRKARNGAAVPLHGDSALDAEVSIEAWLRRSPHQPGAPRVVEADAAAPCRAGGCEAPVAITSGICDRTHAVQHAILTRIRSAVRPPYSGDCRGVTDAWLARLTSIRLVAPHSRVASLKPGDFEGLPNVRQMYISHQPELTELPAGLFEGLTGLEELWVHQNKTITSLPAGAFRGLPRLRVLSLYGNGLADLEPGAFEGLRSLEFLVLQNNRLSDFPFDEFEALPSLTHLYLSDNPGYRWDIDASETSVTLAPGESAAYRLRLTARPCVGGAEIEARWRTLGWGVEVGTPDIAFKQNNWFRSQPVTITARAEAGAQARVLVHEMQSWCYRQQMDDPSPTVIVSVSSRWQLRLAGLPPAQGVRLPSAERDSVVPFAVDTNVLEPRLVAVDPAASPDAASTVRGDGQTASTLPLLHGGPAMPHPIDTGNGTQDASAEMYSLPYTSELRERPDAVPPTGSIEANDFRHGSEFIGYGHPAASPATGILPHPL